MYKKKIVKESVKESEKELETVKCTTVWSVQDVHNEREHQGYSKWTDKQARDWLTSDKIIKVFHEMCLDSGWNVINNFMEN